MAQVDAWAALTRCRPGVGWPNLVVAVQRVEFRRLVVLEVVGWMRVPEENVKGVKNTNRCYPQVSVQARDVNSI